jgi:hypothetical protein
MEVDLYRASIVGVPLIDLCQSQEREKEMTISSPRSIAQMGFGLSLGMSITFNVCGTMLDTNNPVALVMGGAYSAIALVGAEVMTKVKFPAKPRGAKRNPWNMVRYGLVGVATLFSMIITFMHGYSTMDSWGQNGLSCVCGPLSVDMLMVLCGLALLVSPATRKRAKAKPAAKTPRLRKVA